VNNLYGRQDVLRLRRAIKRGAKRLAPPDLRLTAGQRRRIGLPLSRKHKRELIGILLLMLLGIAIGAILKSHHVHHR